ncbi:MAG: hypothetical protein U1E26_12220 [Coriobacteriia bacterium]|nr:hypothetical protein [Coriobacteriia bacterium]
MITFAQIAIGEGGLVACTRCTDSSTGLTASPRDASEVAREITAAAGSWSRGPGPNVTFVGFEPFAHPALPQLIAEAVAAGVVRLRLRTDGGALATGANAVGILAAGVRHLEVVVLAAGEEHDRLSGRSGLAAACDGGVRAFVAAAARDGLRVAVTGRVPVCRHNARGAAGAVAWLASLGAVAVHLDATACREADGPLVLAALDTAAVHGLAASVSGDLFAMAPQWAHRAWAEIEVGE